MTDQSGNNERLAPVFSGAFRSEFETLLRWRRDVRRFLPDPVPGPVLDRILALADLAPSVGNSQPWRIVIVSDEIRRSAIIQSFEAENEIAAGQYDGEKGRLYRQLKLSGLKEAPVHLAIFSEDNPEQGDGLGRMSMPETLAYSTVSMIHTLWLAARTEGVGVGWVSILDPVEVTRALDVDPDWRLVAYLCVGYPQEEHIDPELERARWQARTPLASRLIYR